MRNAALLVLPLISFNAMATWTEVSNTSVAISYIDQSTIQRTGNIVRVWELVDLKSVKYVDGKPVLSYKALVEFDCTERRSRTLTMIDFDQNRTGGNIVATTEVPMDWTFPSPDSAGWSLMTRMCAKKKR